MYTSDETGYPLISVYQPEFSKKGFNDPESREKILGKVIYMEGSNNEFTSFAEAHGGSLVQLKVNNCEAPRIRVTNGELIYLKLGHKLRRNSAASVTVIPPLLKGYHRI